MDSIKVTRDELRGYLKHLSALNIRTRLSILSLSRNLVYYAVFRGDEVQELVEYTALANTVHWNERVDEANHYAWIPEFWRFGKGGRPASTRQDLKVEQLVDHYHEGDILDVATLYAIVLGRGGKKPDHDLARQCVAATLKRVQDEMHSAVHANSVISWKVPDSVTTWRAHEWYHSSKEGALTNLDTALLVRVWAEGYDPLEAEVQRGGVPTEEQSTWEAPEMGKEQDVEYERERKEELLYCSWNSLRALHVRYFGLPA